MTARLKSPRFHLSIAEGRPCVRDRKTNRVAPFAYPQDAVIAAKLLNKKPAANNYEWMEATT